jgi:DNA-binding MarR family transcriptional regulator
MAYRSPHRSELAASRRLANVFRGHGWDVVVEPAGGSSRPDLVIGRGPLRFVVTSKSIGEGRPDRVLPLLSLAILEARRHAESAGSRPLAVMQVKHASPALLGKIESFQREFAPDVAIGVLSDAGGACFIGHSRLEAMNAIQPEQHARSKRVQPRNASDLFSDLNQWMLKVILAPELPAEALNAPRRDYRSVSGLADAADVSPMSASRFIRRLQEEGFLEDAGGPFRLVRRRELFRRWQSAAMGSSPELAMSYVIPGDGPRKLHKVVSGMDACVGLFAAADLLHVGHVSGVAPYVFVRRLDRLAVEWPGLVHTRPGEPAQLILKQARAPQSLFRGAVRVDGLLVSDILQVWLDVSAHPSRGAEQADHLQRKVLAEVMGDRG